MASVGGGRLSFCCGVRGPAGCTTAEVGRALLQRFTLAELHGVQDFLGGRTEILFKTRAAVQKMLVDPSLTVGEHKVCFSYRGSREKVVRVSSYPMDASNDHLKCALSTYGQVSEVAEGDDEGCARSGDGCAIRPGLDMVQPVPNFLGVGRYVVQCEYEGVLRVCRRCNGSGHMAADCKALQCSRCGLFDAHDIEVCERSCPRCGGDHPIAKCSRPSFSAGADSYRPVAPHQLHEAAVHWQMDATRSNLDEQAWPTPGEGTGDKEGATDGSSGSAPTPPDAVAPATAVEDALEEQGPAAPPPENGAPRETSVGEESLQEVNAPPSPKRDWQTSLRTRPGQKKRARNPKGPPADPSPEPVPLVNRYTNLSSDSEESRHESTIVPSTGSSRSDSECSNCGQQQCTCSVMSDTLYEST
ncbi:hypothetical protein HPB48_018876 [Haemaphysalis longicornis]|uniref:CCHC-type domain-containing protein n=1 Tax=Haemaphysalis longicornis TaxID=44386 RepID=A0A9J6GT36_HAELO|nr:hypothetical protein HPB48_018876 [Haemaphysalis longicornis]